MIVLLHHRASQKQIATINEKIEKFPSDVKGYEEEMSKNQARFDELSTKAEIMIEKMEKSTIPNEEFEKVKSTGMENTSRLDKMQKAEKMMNLLISNLPPNTQTIMGFGYYAYHELNVKIGQGDILVQ